MDSVNTNLFPRVVVVIVVVVIDVVVVLLPAMIVTHTVSLSGPHAAQGAENPLWSKIEKNHRMNSHPIIHFLTSEGVSEVSE